MDRRTIRNITIVGGGTAGWLAALYAKTTMPTKVVTLVESKSIPTIGAGEGTTPPFVGLLDVLEIPVSRFVRETGSTIKNGIKFTNWNNGGDKDVFYNSFSAFGNLSPFALSIERYAAGTVPLYGFSVANGDDQQIYDFSAAISKENKVPFRVKTNESYSIENPIFQYEQMGSFALHFDSSKIVKVLKEIALERGIIHIEGDVVDFEENEKGEISKLTLEHGAGIDTDFIFDCSGMGSFFTEKFDSEFVSHKEYLTVNSAMPFFIDMETPIAPYTEAIAMKYGWVWKIPLQDQYRCGYVFDSNYISNEEARQEIIDYLGYEPEWPREDSIKFEAGYLKKPWQKNVISVGLSAGFIEPLEATSIWVAILSLARVLGNSEGLYKIDDRLRDDYNSYSEKLHSKVASFIYLHYMSGRDDTDFWKHYTRENAPEYLDKMLNIVETRNLVFEDIAPDDLFTIDAWFNILLGIKNEFVIQNLKDFEFYNFARSHLSNNYHFYKDTIKHVTEFEAVNHDDFLEALKRDLE